MGEIVDPVKSAGGLRGLALISIESRAMLQRLRSSEVPGPPCTGSTVPIWLSSAISSKSEDAPFECDFSEACESFVPVAQCRLLSINSPEAAALAQRVLIVATARTSCRCCRP